MLRADREWGQIERLAAGAALRLKPLGADSGGPNPAQYTRVPTTRNTKARAGRFRVRYVKGAGPVEADALAAAALPGGVTDLGRSTGSGSGADRERRASSTGARRPRGR